MKIFIYGANGQVGSGVLDELLKSGHEVLAGTRKPENGKKANQLTWVFADASKPSEGLEVLSKVDAAFFLSPPGLTNQFQILNPWIEKAKEVKLKKFVLMTAMGVEYAPPEVPMRKVELTLINSGLVYNIIRPNWFMQNFQTYWISGILATGKILFPGGNAKTSFIDVKDISSTAAALLTSSKFDNKEFTLTGDEAITHDEVAEKISKATGKTITYMDISSEEFKKGLLSAGLPNDYSEFLVMIAQSLKEGNAAPITTAVKDICGKSAIKFQDYAEANKKAWS
ncbi:MAG: NAD(P)H-binding protein [Leptospiraceae bacterium]|nr:NAD(P)H-binding protein [Leptospiraceae bacterium]